MSRYISCVDTAKLVRAALKKAFPSVKFSVRSDTYSMGASIDVRWTNGPLTKQVESVVAPFSGAGFDGMIDLKYSKSAWLMPDGSATHNKCEGTTGSKGVVESSQHLKPSHKAEEVHFGADYIFCNREYTPDFYARAVDAVCRRHGVDRAKVEIKTHDGERPYIANQWAVSVGETDLGTLVHRELVRRTGYLKAAA